MAVCNQLRAHLRVVFPVAVGLFRDLDSPISLAFLARFPTVERAAWLSHRRLRSWLAANAYSGRTPTRVLLERLQTAPDGLHGDAAAAAAHTTSAYVATLAAHAGAAPSTKQSGRHHVVVFCWACDHKLREAINDFAADNRRASPLGRRDLRPPPRRRQNPPTRHPHPRRAWLRVIWRCWQDGAAYDPTKHGGNQPFLTPNTNQVDQAA